MLLQENVQPDYSLYKIQRVETQSYIYSFEIIDHTLYYLCNNNLIIYDLENNKILMEVQFNSFLSAISIQGNNIYIAQDQKIIQFNIQNQNKNIIAQYKDSSVKKIVVINNLLIYLKYDLAQLFITDIKLNKTIRKLKCFEDYAWDYKISFKQNKLIAVTYADWVYQGIKIYDLDSLKLFSYFKSDFYYSLAEFSDDQQYIFIADKIRVRQYNIRTQELIYQTSDKQIYGMRLYQQQLYILLGQQILLVNYENKDDIQEFMLPNGLFHDDKYQCSSNEFINALRVNQFYIGWIINIKGKGFYIQRKQ